MKQRFLIVTIVAGSWLTVAALADDSSLHKASERNPSLSGSMDAMSGERLAGAHKASDIIGMEVKNYQNEKLGKVDDLAVDVESGRVVEVVLSVGGLLGVGDALVAVPPSALHYDVAAKVIHLNADKERLKSAPRFEVAHWNGVPDTNRITEVYRYYDQELYFVRTVRVDDATRSPKDSEKPVALRIPPLSPPPAYLQRASKLMGTSVKNLQNEKLGKVENLMVDLSTGRIVAVIVSSGGFLGMGNELSAIPPAAMRFNSERDVLVLDASKETLSQAPHFKANQWPDLGEPRYTAGVYRAYRVEPYFNPDADNTARNVRDRDDRTLTPGDQGNSEADVDTTRRIRKEIVAHDGMSINARNVKIITANGRVTLRGPVKTAEEKGLIGSIAARIAQPVNVDNQLEVKAN